MTFDRRAIPPSAAVSTCVAADGWPLRTYVQPPVASARGSILWLGGRGDIVEKYLETLDHWARSGWHVTSFDWRGQGGSGRLTGNAHVGHTTSFAVWIDDLAGFVSRWQAETPSPHVVTGHSMGGHLVLRALVERRITPDRAVLVAPMLGFDSGPLPFGVASIVAKLMARLTSSDRPAWKHNEKPTSRKTTRQSLLTHDDARYADELWWKEQIPGLALGPPSWAWLAEAYRSVGGLRRPGTVEAIATPILIVGSEGDKLVSPAAMHEFAARIPDASLHMFGAEVAHEILRENDLHRDAALRVIDEFIEAA